MEGKAPEAEERAAGAPGEESGPGAAAEAADSCCVFETTVSEGRTVTVCVATCCGAAPAAPRVRNLRKESSHV